MAHVSKRIRKTKNGTRTDWYVDYVDAFGNRKRAYGFERKADAEAGMENIIEEIKRGNGSTQDKSITFAKAAADYMDYHTSLRCKPSTIYSYESYIKNHLNTFFGKMKLVEITPMRINY